MGGSAPQGDSWPRLPRFWAAMTTGKYCWHRMSRDWGAAEHPTMHRTSYNAQDSPLDKEPSSPQCRQYWGWQSPSQGDRPCFRNPFRAFNDDMRPQSLLKSLTAQIRTRTPCPWWGKEDCWFPFYHLPWKSPQMALFLGQWWACEEVPTSGRSWGEAEVISRLYFGVDHKGLYSTRLWVTAEHPGSVGTQTLVAVVAGQDWQQSVRLQMNDEPVTRLGSPPDSCLNGPF